MKIYIILVLFLLVFTCKTNDSIDSWERDYDEGVSLIIDEIRKRNDAGCERLGNVYGYCEWIVVLKVINNSNKSLKQFCSYLKVNQKKFDFCYGNKKKVFLKRRNEKKVLLNLYELIGFPNKYEQPIITLSNKKFIF